MIPAARPSRGVLKDLLLFGALVALLLQSLSPPGFMPGSLSSGWLVVLCPEGLPADFLGHGHHHHDPADAGTGHVDQGLGGHCPLGGMLNAAAAMSFAVSAAVLHATDPVSYPAYLAPALARRTQSHLTRAPPLRP
jgi:hypothetical protein